MSSAALITQALQAPPEVQPSLFHLAQGEAIRESMVDCCGPAFTGTPSPIAYVTDSYATIPSRFGWMPRSSLYTFPQVHTTSCDTHLAAQLNYLGSWCLALCGPNALARFLPDTSFSGVRGTRLWHDGYYLLITHDLRHAEHLFLDGEPATLSEFDTDISVLPVIRAGDIDTPHPKDYDASGTLEFIGGANQTPLDRQAVRKAWRKGYVVVYSRYLADTVVVVSDERVRPQGEHALLPRYTLGEVERLRHVSSQAQLRRIHLLKRELGAEVAV